MAAAWTIEQRHQADFNRDGRADVLLLLRQAATEGATPRHAEHRAAMELALRQMTHGWAIIDRDIETGLQLMLEGQQAW